MSTVTIVGAGVIGLSFARLFANAGWSVRVSDPRPDLEELVGTSLAGLNATTFADLTEAAEGTDFVQESGPERVDLKQQIFQTLAAATRDDVVLASSSSSLPASTFAPDGAVHRTLIGHPFNPPELIPLIEIVPTPDTSQASVVRAMEVYRALGKVPIPLKKEIPGFVGNRLQKALNDQSTYLVQQGVIDVQDLDELVKASLGIRWATIGPFESRHLGGGPGGMRHIIEHVGSQMSFDLGEPDRSNYEPVIGEVEAAYGGSETYQDRVEQRDRATRAVIDVLKDVRKSR